MATLTSKNGGPARLSDTPRLSDTARLSRSEQFFGQLPEELVPNVAVAFRGDRKLKHVHLYAFVVRPDEPIGQISMVHLSSDLKKASRGQFEGMEGIVEGTRLYADFHGTKPYVP